MLTCRPRDRHAETTGALAEGWEGTCGHTLVSTTSVAGAAAPTVRSEHAECIEAAVADVLSANTRRAYATAWRAWSAWCASERIEPLPAQPVHVAAYLAERAEDGVGISTLRTAVAAIAHEHASRGAPSPAIHPGVRRVLRGLSRRQAWDGHTPRQAAALTGEVLAAIRVDRAPPAHRPRRPHRDGRASAPPGRHGRRHRHGDARRPAASLRGRRAHVGRRGSAIPTARAGSRCAAARATRRARAPSSLSAATRSRRWSASARRLPSPESSVFGGLRGRAIADRIRKAARAAGLEGDYSGHSPRIGMARDLAASGASTTALMLAGRWRSERMPALYARGELAGRGPVARYYGPV